MHGKLETKVGLFVLIAIAILAYMGFHIGAFRFNKEKYTNYTVCFRDAAGVSRKADVKISGVKVGWIDSIGLPSGKDNNACLFVCVHNDYPLYEDAYAEIKQDSILGSKYIEIFTGTDSLPKLLPNARIVKRNIEASSADDLIKSFKGIADNVEKITKNLANTIGTQEGQNSLQSMMNNMQKATTHIAGVSKKLEIDLFPEVTEAVQGAKKGISSGYNVLEKLENGSGLLGKLIHDEEVSRDVRGAILGLKNYVSKIDMVHIVFDPHFETMYRPAENYEFENTKGYLEMRVYPRIDYFYMAQIVNSQKGFVSRTERIFDYYDPKDDKLIDTSNLELPDFAKLWLTLRRKKTIINRNQFRLGLQFGKSFGSLSLRFGLFDGTGGAGIDFDIPFPTDKLRWITTLEGFDFYGWNRIDDRRPHLKWINRVFIMDTIYLTFGADDFVSKKNANAFFGAGIRFGDDEVKYLLSSMGSSAGNSGSI